MNIAIVGYGKMGRMIESLAIARNHQVIARFDEYNNVNGEGLTSENLKGVDVAIEFSTPDSVIQNITGLAELKIPTVVGTTGWHSRIDEVKKIVDDNKSTLIYGANYSIGVNLFYKVVREAAALFAKYEEYDPFIIEQHHKFKKDAPSGTALVVEKFVRESYGERTPQTLALRAGHIPGTHEVGFDSEADTITIVHTARSRQGFASGAVLAAEKAITITGVHEFSKLLFEM